MEQFAQGRPEDEKLRSWLCGIEQDAIRELDENGVLLALTERSARLVQDPDPQVRQREKTDLAKSVGRQLVSAIMPVPSKNGMSFLTTLHYDPRFVNSVTLFVRESMERMRMALANEPQKKQDRYMVQIISGEGDSSALAANLQQLERMYPEFSVELMRDGRLLYPPERKNERPKPLVAVNVGSLGIIISSLASLITLKEFLKHQPKGLKRYMLMFTGINTTFLIVQLLVTFLRR